MSSVLVTGATGFVGKVLCRKLKGAGHKVFQLSSANGDIRSSKIFDTLRGEGIDHVYHLAAKSFVPDSWEQPSDFVDVNVNGTLNVLEFCKAQNATLTFISSYVYAANVALPTPESADIQAQNPYGMSKVLGEQLCSHYARFFDIDVQVVRPFNLFGPGQPNHFLIPRMINIAKGLDKQALGNIEVSRDFIHVEDLCELLLLMVGQTGFEVYNAGLGLATPLKEIAEAIGISGSVRTSEKRKNEIKATQADITKAEQLGWRPAQRVTDFVLQEIN